MKKTAFFKLFLAVCTALLITACSDDENETTSGAGADEPNVIDASNQNIVDVAVGAAPEFTTLVAALQTAGLVDTLSGIGPFTVFAPTNAAFAAIQDTIDTLSVEELRAILIDHVLSGIRPASDIPATSGAPATVVGDAIRASNGIIYPIDQVLLP